MALGKPAGEGGVIPPFPTQDGAEVTDVDTMYSISDDDRRALLALLPLIRGLRPATLADYNRLRRARIALKRLQRKERYG